MRNVTFCVDNYLADVTTLEYRFMCVSFCLAPVGLVKCTVCVLRAGITVALRVKRSDTENKGK